MPNTCLDARTIMLTGYPNHFVIINNEFRLSHQAFATMAHYVSRYFDSSSWKVTFIGLTI